VRPARPYPKGAVAGIACLLIGALGSALALLGAGGRDHPSVELLDPAAPRGAPVTGTWSATGAGLRCSASPLRRGLPADERMRVYDLRYAPPEEYDFELEFTRHSGSVVHVLAAGDHCFLHELRPVRDATAPARSGFSAIDGMQLDRATEGFGDVPAPSPADERHVVIVQVRRNEVRSFLDGQEIVRWQGDLARLALPERYRLGGAQPHLGLACRGGEVTCHRATVREVTGAGTLVTDSISAGNGAVTVR
jgi:hypothetical protein